MDTIDEIFARVILVHRKLQASHDRDDQVTYPGASGPLAPMAQPWSKTLICVLMICHRGVEQRRKAIYSAKYPSDHLWARVSHVGQQSHTEQ